MILHCKIFHLNQVITHFFQSNTRNVVEVGRKKAENKDKIGMDMSVSWVVVFYGSNRHLLNELLQQKQTNCVQKLRDESRKAYLAKRHLEKIEDLELQVLDDEQLFNDEELVYDYIIVSKYSLWISRRRVQMQLRSSNYIIVLFYDWKKREYMLVIA